MNKHIHRLVFDRRRGMRVPAAETARSAGKAAGGQTRATAVVAAGVLSVLALSEAAHAQQRGSAEGAVSRLSGVTFGTERVSAGVEAALSRGYPNLPTYTADGNWKQNIGDHLDPTKSADGKIMTLVQKGKTIILNWDTFNIGQGYELRFEQKTGDRAFNRVYDINPSVINGTLTGAGEIVIENRNGVVFGPNARVQAGSLVATALQLTNDAFLKNPTNPSPRLSVATRTTRTASSALRPGPRSKPSPVAMSSWWHRASSTRARSRRPRVRPSWQQARRCTSTQWPTWLSAA